MFPDVLQGLRNFFGRDFLLGVSFPTLIFVSINFTLYLEVKIGLAQALATWEKFSLQSQLLFILWGFIVVMVLSYLIYNFQYNIIRLFEGYWPRNRIVDRIRGSRVKLYSRRWQYLEELKQSAKDATVKSQIEAEQFAFYPPETHPGEVMPTRIGNILRASEIYAFDRYGIDAVIIWTRLRLLLSNEVVMPLTDIKTARDFMLLMSAFSATFTLFWCTYLAVFTSRWEMFLICALGWPLAWICYKSAVQSSFAYSELLKTVFDLHRLDLLNALNRKIPESAVEERKEWNRLKLFYYRNLPLQPAPPAPTDKAQSLDEVVKTLMEYLKKVNPPAS